MSVLVCVLLLFVIGHCIDELGEEIIDGSNGFGFDLSSELYTDSSTNIFISPFCITSCFSLIYPGSAGNTKTEIANVLGFPSNTESDDVTQQFFALQSMIESSYNGEFDEYNERRSSVIGIANKIYSSPQINLQQTYIDALNDGQESFINNNFDFTSDDAVSIINEWVYNNTNGLIDSILSEDADISNWVLAAIFKWNI